MNAPAVDQTAPSAAGVTITAEEFGVRAEMFSRRRSGARARQPIQYRRFETLAEAVRFAIEDAPNEDPSICTDTRRFSGGEIAALHSSKLNPLWRRNAAGIKSERLPS